MAKYIFVTGGVISSLGKGIAAASIGRLLEICLEMVRGCPCDEGCPSCVGLPQQRPAIHSDPDLSRGYPVPSKAAAEHLAALLVADDSVAIAAADRDSPSAP